MKDLHEKQILREMEKMLSISVIDLANQEVERIVQFIEAEMDRNFGLIEMAALLGRNPFIFSRAFRNTTGESPHQFVVQRRIARARELQFGTKEPLADIAYDCGFSSQVYLASMFGKHTGTTPGAHRKETA